MKKILAMLLALVLVLSMGGAAMAADTGSITINNAKVGETYTAYKIFDVVYNEDKSAYSYTIDSSSEWFEIVQNYTGITLTQVNGTTTFNVAQNESFGAPEFSNHLKESVEGKTGTTLTYADGKATAIGLDLGYYFVTAPGALCNLTTTTPDTVIYNKNDVPFDKVDDQESVDVGQTVKYTITGKVPSTTGFDSYTYKITDTMSDGLTFNKDVKVYVDGAELSADHYTVTYNGTDDGFVLNIEVMEIQDKVAKEIRVEYSAVVNKNAVAQIENNKAQLEYSNDPTDENETQKTPEDVETVYSAKIVIDKYATDDESKKLAGAQFVLLDEEDKFYKVDDNGNVSWVATQEEATVVTTDAQGAASFDGLADGTYKLREIKAPDGYNKLIEDVSVTITGEKITGEDGKQTIKIESLTVTSEVANNTGSELPSTGGIGTTIFYVAGGILMLFAVVVLVTRKKMSSEN